MLISDGYRAQLRDKHASYTTFGTGGHRLAKLVHSVAERYEVRTILDYGCGKGTLKTVLTDEFSAPYDVLEYDPAVPGKEQKPLRADLVVCGDVMEHVEPDYLGAVLDDIRNTARLGVIFVVAVCPAKKTLADGRNAHLIVEPIDWWLHHLIARWDTRRVEHAEKAFLYVGESR